MFGKNKKIIKLMEEVISLKKELEMYKSIPKFESVKEDYVAVESESGEAVMYIPASEKNRIDREGREREGRDA